MGLFVKRPMKREKGKFSRFKLTKRGINLLINLRLNGWSQNAIGYFLGIDRHLVLFYCKKYGIEGEAGISIPFFVDEKYLQWKYLDREKVNMGHSYADYRRIEEGRNRLPSLERKKE